MLHKKVNLVVNVSDWETEHDDASLHRLQSRPEYLTCHDRNIEEIDKRWIQLLCYQEINDIRVACPALQHQSSCQPAMEWYGDSQTELDLAAVLDSLCDERRQPGAQTGWLTDWLGEERL